MTYEELIGIINDTCSARGISVYRLSKLSSIPASTLYGVLRQDNKAQFDTLCEMLKALDLQLVVEPIRLGELPDGGDRRGHGERSSAGLSKEKQEVLRTLERWLRES